MVASLSPSDTGRMAAVGAAGSAPTPALIIETGSGLPRLVPLGATETVVGSARGCDLQVHGAFVSRRHCRLLRADGTLWIEDLGSANGTEVDGVPVARRCALVPGALVHLGDVGLTVVTLVPGPAGQVAVRQVCRFEDMVGADPRTLDRFHRLNRIAASAAPVLLSGPSGVGKELHARAVHRRSRRRDGPFEPVNCGALPPTLAEAELFGCRRGAFTGAERDREGAFARADGGTLFLDEVGELPPEVQPKLLRALETGEIRPLGASRAEQVDVRLVAATNRRLWKEVEAGRFRADLLFRLEGVTLEVPPLAARPADVAPLAAELLAAVGGGRRSLSAAASGWLAAQRWDGNVRELRNLLAAAVALTRRPVLEPEDLRGALVERAPFAGAAPAGTTGLVDRAIVAALREQAGSRKAAMHRLGIPRSTFYARLRRLRGAGLLADGP